MLRLASNEHAFLLHRRRRRRQQLGEIERARDEVFFGQSPFSQMNKWQDRASTPEIITRRYHFIFVRLRASRKLNFIYRSPPFLTPKQGELRMKTLSH